MNVVCSIYKILCILARKKYITKKLDKTQKHNSSFFTTEKVSVITEKVLIRRPLNAF
jgi:hypothetical protein